MIKLLLLLCTFSAVFAQETLYNFPAHHSRFVHQVHRSLKNSSNITIITPHYRFAELNKAILVSAKRGSKVQFIVHAPHGDPLSLIQYQGIHLFISPVSLGESIILIDDALVCTTNEILDDEILTANHSSIRCSDDKSKIKAVRHSLTPLLKHSKSYLE
jgi:hypothetical protein